MRPAVFYFIVRDAFASIELIETFLYRRHKLNALGDLLEQAVVRQCADRFGDNLFLCHGPIMRFSARLCKRVTVLAKL